MGWTCVNSVRGASTKEMLARNSSYYEGSAWKGGANEEFEYYIETIQPGKGGLYGVLRKTNVLTGQALRMALVIAVERKGGQCCWKEMTEFDGPYYFGMPVALFNQLSPLAEFEPDRSIEHAQGWREKMLEKYKEKADLGRIEVGDVLEFQEPLTFTLDNVVKVQRFRVQEWGRKRRLQALPDSGARFVCRLSRYAWSLPFTVSKPA